MRTHGKEEDKERGKQGNTETRKHGDKETGEEGIEDWEEGDWVSGFRYQAPFGEEGRELRSHRQGDEE